MDLYTGLTPFGILFVVLAVVAAAAALATIGDFVVRNRRARLARHESIHTYYRGLAFSR